MGQSYAPQTSDVCVEPVPEVVDETCTDDQTLLGNSEIQSRLEDEGGMCWSEEPSPLLVEDASTEEEEAQCGDASFASRAACMFPDVDADGDGYLSEEDIDNALMKPDLSAEDASAIAMMKRYRGNLEELSNDEFGDEDDGVTAQDIEKYRQALEDVKANGGRMPEDLGQLEGLYKGGVARVNDTSDELFPDGAPSLDAIKQGNVESCALVAAAGSMVQEGRGDEIQEMIAKNEDGSYTVTFPGKPPVTVSAPTNGEIAYGSTAGKNGLWLTVLEKAYGQYKDDDNTVAADGADGKERPAISTLTGHDVNVDQTAFTKESTEDARLQDALDNDRVVTASILHGNAGGMEGDHAYTVVNYDPSTKTVTLRNPWGHGDRKDEHGKALDGKDDGVFTLTLDEFDKYFTDVAYEEAK